MAQSFYVSPAGDDRWSGRLPAPNAIQDDGPLATLPRAQAAVRALAAGAPLREPVRVELRDGVYHLAEPLIFTPADSGAAAPTGDSAALTGPARTVTYAAYAGEQPVLSGGRRVGGWRPVQANGHSAWVTGLPEVAAGEWSFTQLWVNGRRAQRPRLPKQGLYQIAELLDAGTGAPPGLFDGQDAFRYAPGDLADWRNIGDVEIVALHYWIESRIPLASVDPAERVAHLQWRSRMRLTDDFHPQGAPYYVENVFEALGEPGEWYLDRPAGQLYYIPRSGEDMATAEVYAPYLRQLMFVQGDVDGGLPVAHLAFEGLAFSHSEWVPGPEAAVASPQAACHIPGAVVVAGAHDCRFTRCCVTHVGSYAIEITDGSRDITVEHGTLSDLGGGGVKIWHTSPPATAALSPGSGPDMLHTLSCRRVIVSDNEIADGGHRYHQAVGALIGRCSGVQLLHNHIHDFDYSGVSVGWTWSYADGEAYGNIVEYNHIHDIGRGMLSDMGGIYTLGVQPGTRLRYNLIHDVQSRGYGGWGIYNDEGSSYILIENNIVYRTKSNPYNQHYGRANVVRNNIFAYGGEAQFSRSRIEPHNSFAFTNNILYFENDGTVLAGRWSDLQAVIDCNLYYNVSGAPLSFAGSSFADWQARGADTQSIVTDPRFRDPANGDFTLAPDSPALAIGFVPFDLSEVGPRI